MMDIDIDRELLKMALRPLVYVIDDLERRGLHKSGNDDMPVSGKEPDCPITIGTLRNARRLLLSLERVDSVLSLFEDEQPRLWILDPERD